MLQTAAQKRELAQWGAMAADMESAAVAASARCAGVPWLAVRAVADAADVTLPSAIVHAMDGQGRVRVTRLAAALLRRPRDVAAIPPLAHGFYAALGTLRAVAHRAGPALLAPMSPPAGTLGGVR
jgi:adenosylhomocysteine nucleosidase